MGTKKQLPVHPCEAGIAAIDEAESWAEYRKLIIAALEDLEKQNSKMGERIFSLEKKVVGFETGVAIGKWAFGLFWGIVGGVVSYYVSHHFLGG